MKARQRELHVQITVTRRVLTLLRHCKKFSVVGYGEDGVSHKELNKSLQGLITGFLGPVFTRCFACSNCLYHQNISLIEASLCQFC